MKDSRTIFSLHLSQNNSKSNAQHLKRMRLDIYKLLTVHIVHCVWDYFFSGHSVVRNALVCNNNNNNNNNNNSRFI